jgi:hypothetical protein
MQKTLSKPSKKSILDKKLNTKNVNEFGGLF